jgi:hypothetical protein
VNVQFVTFPVLVQLRPDVVPLVLVSVGAPGAPPPATPVTEVVQLTPVPTNAVVGQLTAVVELAMIVPDPWEAVKAMKFPPPMVKNAPL